MLRGGRVLRPCVGSHHRRCSSTGLVWILLVRVLLVRVLLVWGFSLRCHRRFHCWSKLEHLCTVLLPAALPSPVRAASCGPTLAAPKAPDAWEGGEDLGTAGPSSPTLPGITWHPRSAAWGGPVPWSSPVCSSSTINWLDWRNPTQLRFFLGFGQSGVEFPH